MRFAKLCRFALLGALIGTVPDCATTKGVDAGEGDTELAKVQVRRLATACEQYQKDKGAAPERLDQLAGAYLEVVPKDPWGRDFYLATPGTCEIASAGRDGVRGNADDFSSKGELPTAYTK